VGWILLALLAQIRGKLEAIRFIMDHNFNEKHAPKFDEDGELSPPPG
jgi:hypothetical protein